VKSKLDFNNKSNTYYCIWNTNLSETVFIKIYEEINLNSQNVIIFFLNHTMFKNACKNIWWIFQISTIIYFVLQTKKQQILSTTSRV